MFKTTKVGDFHATADLTGRGKDQGGWLYQLDDGQMNCTECCEDKALQRHFERVKKNDE